MSDRLIGLIEKLSNTNYHHWAIRMKVLLTKEGCWDAIEKECPAATDANGKKTWLEQSSKALPYITLCVGNDQLVLIEEAKTAQEAWNKLKGYHLKATLSVRVRLLRKICKAELPKGDNMEKHLQSMMESFSLLKESGYKLDEKIINHLMLSSVNEEEYGSLITALEARDEDTLTTEIIRNKLLEEYEKRENEANAKDAAVAYRFGMANKRKKFGKKQNQNKKCYFCKKPGHFKSQCEEFRRWGNGKSNSPRSSDHYANSARSDEMNYAYLCIKADHQD